MGCGAASHRDATEKDMADDALVFDRHEAQLGDERSRTAKRLNETRFVWLTEGQLVDSEDLLMMRCGPGTKP